ncbi:MAG: hypothetical protein RL260_2585 [Pseudomonadota bacterium]|jgi:transcriptional regulator with XRE-family HTH domain
MNLHTPSRGSPIQELVQRKRHELALSMSDLADRAGITRSHLYSLLNGATRDPSVHTLTRLSGALHVSPIVLLRHYLHDHRHTADPREAPACAATPRAHPCPTHRPVSR